MTRKLLITDDARAASLRNNRQCGECCACCVLPRIPDLHKPGYSPCTYLATCGPVMGGQCNAYDYRPDVCRDYQCLWRMGCVDGDTRRRPDQLGLMFSVDTVDGRPVVECWELWEGAARDYPGRGVLEAMVSETPVLVRWYGVPCSLRYHGPASMDLGWELSRWAREEPRLLAKWVDKKTTVGKLETPDPAAIVDLEAFRRGEPVVAHFGRDGRLRLPMLPAVPAPQAAPCFA